MKRGLEGREREGQGVDEEGGEKEKGEESYRMRARNKRTGEKQKKNRCWESEGLTAVPPGLSRALSAGSKGGRGGETTKPVRAPNRREGAPSLPAENMVFSTASVRQWLTGFAFLAKCVQTLSLETHLSTAYRATNSLVCTKCWEEGSQPRCSPRQRKWVEATCQALVNSGGWS